MTYLRFGAMILTSTVVMFGLMYLNTYAVEHVFFSETRAYMALVMGAIMAVIMLGFMWGMYKRIGVNLVIIAGAVVTFSSTLWLVRSQTTVGDVSFMRAMIPHHSIAIMTSKRANFSDPRVQKLATEIVAAQEKEISEMRFLINDITQNGDAGDDWPLGEQPVELKSLQDALDSAEIAAVDPQALSPAEIADVLAGRQNCWFRRAVDSDPILVAATDGANGFIKLNGDLVQLSASGAGVGSRGAEFGSDGARLTVFPTANSDSANLLFELDRGLRVGYSGYWNCR